MQENIIEYIPLLIIVAILVSGLFNVFFPKVQWYLTWGWRYRGSTGPSAIWLFFTRLGGFITVTVMLVVLYCYFNPDNTPQWMLDLLKAAEKNQLQG